MRNRATRRRSKTNFYCSKFPSVEMPRQTFKDFYLNNNTYLVIKHNIYSFRVATDPQKNSLYCVTSAESR